jgi:hypothetical protein
MTRITAKGIPAMNPAKRVDIRASPPEFVSVVVPSAAILIMDVIALRAVGVASPECFFQGEAIFFNCLGDCFVAQNAPRSDILRIAEPSANDTMPTMNNDILFINANTWRAQRVGDP